MWTPVTCNKGFSNVQHYHILHCWSLTARHLNLCSCNFTFYKHSEQTSEPHTGDSVRPQSHWVKYIFLLKADKLKQSTTTNFISPKKKYSVNRSHNSISHNLTFMLMKWQKYLDCLLHTISKLYFQRWACNSGSTIKKQILRRKCIQAHNESKKYFYRMEL